MIRVLFVCLGNICRSPMAEAIFRHLVAQEGLSDTIQVDSAGTGDWHKGEIPHKGTREILDQHNISYQGIVARQFQKSDFQRFNYIVAMDASNMKDIERFGNEAGVEVVRLLDYVPEIENKNVPDPWYTGDFEETYRLVRAGCEALLRHIRMNEGI